MRVNNLLVALSITVALFVAACSSGSGSVAPAVGVLSGTVTAGNPAAALADVSVIVFDASTNAPAASSVLTDSAGNYSFNLNAGSYYVKLYKQGYDPVPSSALLTPVPLTVASGTTTSNNVLMTASVVANSGWISGKVTSGASGVGGVLVAAEAAGVAYTSFTDSVGNYAIYNVPAASYNVKAYIGGYSSDAPTASVIANTGTTGINPTLTAIATGGSVTATFGALLSATGVTRPSTMVTSLVHPITKETIPGLSLSMAYAPPMDYVFNGVADGTYIVRTTYANDTIVVDPDYILKFGEPTVTVASGAQTAAVSISCTSAVLLTGATTNAMTSTTPVLVAASPAPMFNWTAYAGATNGYGIEVMDASTGTIVWGGIGNSGGTLTINVPVAAGATSVTYAGPALTVGKTYRWRIYASASTPNLGPGTWKLISMSEDQMGLITIQ